jgi:hypothetical protein
MLALDRSLLKPTPRSALLFGIISAAIATAALPPFTYLVVMAGAVYVTSYVLTRLATTSNMRETLRDLSRSGASLAGGAVIALALSAYLLFGLWQSTLPLVDETGGYELDDVAARLPPFSDAAALQPLAYTQGPLWLDGITNALVVFVCLTAAIALNFRVGAFLFLYMASVLFASNVETPAYQFLFDNVPYFSLVRGSGRWIALATFSIAFAAGTAGWLAVTGRAASATIIRERHWPLLMPGAMVLGIGSLGMVAIFVATHLPSAREWHSPYSVEPELSDALRVLNALDSPSAFATSPFLATRLTGDPYISAIDFGKTLGPGISGMTAFGGLRAGGLTVNDTAREITDSLRTEVTSAGDFMILQGPPTELFVVTSDFEVTATLKAATAAAAPFELQFFDRARNTQVTLRISPADGTAQLLTGVDVRAPVGTFPVGATDGDLVVNVRKVGSRLTASVTPGGEVEAVVIGVGAASVLGFSESGARELARAEAVRVRADQRTPDEAIIRLLDLMRVERFLVQPHASQIEAARISGLDDLALVEEWPSAAIYEIAGYHPERAYVTDSYGLFLNQPGRMVPGLYQLTPLADSLTPLIAVEDIPASGFSEVVGEARFLGVSTPVRDPDIAARLAEALDLGARPPLIIIPESSSDLSEQLGSPYGLPSSEYVLGPIEIWSTSRDYVFEAVAAGTGGGALNSPVTILNSALVGNTGAVVRLDPVAGAVTVSELRSGIERVIASGVFTPSAHALPFRVALIGQELTVIVDETVALRATVASELSGGPLSARAEGEPYLLLDPALSTGREGAEFLERALSNGFSIARMSESGGQPRRDLLNLFPRLSGVSSILRGLPDAEYRALVRVENMEGELVTASVAGARETQELTLEPLPDIAGTGETWMLSGPFRPEPGVNSNMLIATQGAGAKVVSALLIEEMDEGAGEALAASLLTPQMNIPARLDRHSATSYSGPVDLSGGRLLVFRDAYNKGWEMKAGGQELEQVRLFGTLAGFWAPEDTGQGPVEIDLRFTPQRVFLFGKLISLLAALCVAGAALWLILGPRARERFRRQSTHGARQ